MPNPKPLILLSNDDGIQAVGLLYLKRETKKIGEVVIVAPDRPRSSCSHAITLHKPLRVTKLYDRDGDLVYACNGMPADCVVLGIREICPRIPDLVIGGINEGPNLGNDVIYSGTLAVAREAALEGVKAFAISVAGSNDVHYETGERIALWIAYQLLETPLPDGVFLNVNVPNVSVSDINGLRITRRGFKRYVGNIEKRTDPQGRVYFWRSSERPINEVVSGTDVTEVENNFVSITPMHVDPTFSLPIDALEGWSNSFSKDFFNQQRYRK